MNRGGWRSWMASRRQWWVGLAAVAGVAVLVWTVASVGPEVLVQQARRLGAILPLVLVLAGARFALQACGWCLAMEPHQRPRCTEAFAAVVAGEAAGYFAWGPVSREPVKALFVGHRVPERAGLTAALVERFAYSAAATMLTVVAIGILAVRAHRVGWLAFGLGTAVTVFVVGTRMRRRWTTARDDARPSLQNGSTTELSSGVPHKTFSHVWRELRRERPRALAGMAALAGAQELTNVFEAYLVLAWLGGSPTLAGVVMFEGMSRLLNAAGQFVPGKLGVSEGIGAALAGGLRLGSAHGLSLALARRFRSLLWAAFGVALLTFHAAGARRSAQVRARASLSLA